MSGKNIARETAAPFQGKTEKNPEQAEKLKEALQQESDSVASRAIAQVIKDEEWGRA